MSSQKPAAVLATQQKVAEPTRTTRQSLATKDQTQVAPTIAAGLPEKKRSSSAIVKSSFKDSSKNNSTKALLRGGLTNSKYIQKPAA